MQHLEFGQTPWDNLDDEALEREIERMTPAFSAAYACVQVTRMTDSRNPYWLPGGMGARDYEMMRQIVEGDEIAFDSRVRLRQVQRMFAALSGARSCLYRQEVDREACVQGMIGTIINPIEAEYAPGELWRRFFRYAYDLLFVPTALYRIGSYWLMCDACHDLVGGDQSNWLNDGKSCADFMRVKCPGTLHVLTWADLAPREMIAEADALPGRERE